MKNRILIVEDESSIRSLLKVSFQCDDYIIIEAETGEEGIERAIQEKPDVVLLDIMLPGIDGFDVCTILRQELPKLGIIMLTARSQDIDKIKGLECGVDDYVIKPFNPRELILRVKALLRRIDENTMEKQETILKDDPFKVEITARKVYKKDKNIELTPKEYSLLKLFIENPGKAFTRDELLNLIWGWDFYGESKIVDVNIRRLRQKIEEIPSQPVYIETVWGTGYRWRKLSDIDQ